ncbi:exosortase-dependent surface protein XDP1 [Catenovulum adriaticum]|uniref:PEP-CTERM sorting domain-containing protein n=1 Tax=Catenovulum adriaticum TaxID=2984846 RepID=A0ABY7AKD6_9ALTE|nr:exosortase-dependent surface protein XDP1 [Catenovulum sp. TS8]WAJ69795.1 PEP-CTERM sorting domain-containing protein [Catenovulum sp. TS8]
MNKIILTVFALLFSGASFAANQTWDFKNTDSNLNNNSTGNTWSDSQGGVDLAATAWADTDEEYDCSGLQFGLWCSSGWNVTNQVESARIDTNSHGLLAYNQNIDAHTIDNFIDYDMILLSFSKDVNLSGITLGWAFPDSDITVAAFDSEPSLSGETWDAVASSASDIWTFENVSVNSYYDFSADTAGVNSQYWLVGAYNASFEYLHDCISDAIKIAGITTSTTTSGKPVPVPEPASILLFLAGLFGVMLKYRKQTKY